MKTALVGLLAFLILPVIAEDQTSALVLALNTAASRLVTEGKLDKAEGLYYRVLANDENCPEALYELGKMLEKQGKLVSAGEFFNHAIKQFAKIEKPNTAVVAKKQDAERRLNILNPHAIRLAALLNDYSAELDRIGKAYPNQKATQEAIESRKEMIVVNKFPNASESKKATQQSLITAEYGKDRTAMQMIMELNMEDGHSQADYFIGKTCVQSLGIYLYFSINDDWAREWGNKGSVDIEIEVSSQQKTNILLGYNAANNRIRATVPQAIDKEWSTKIFHIADPCFEHRQRGADFRIIGGMAGVYVSKITIIYRKK